LHVLIAKTKQIIVQNSDKTER